MLKAERPDSLDVLWADRQAYLLQLLQRSFDVARVPENDGIDDKTQRPKLVLLSFTVALAQSAKPRSNVQNSRNDDDVVGEFRQAAGTSEIKRDVCVW